MRLINATSLKIEEFLGASIPPYAILSHTWGDDEVTFQDSQNISRAALKGGFTKIQGACDQAIRDALEYVWVDTCCIDKTSSAELSEAINSMFAWYRDAFVCYVYLADTPDTFLPLSGDDKVDKGNQFCQSNWFTRGWTLQELLAPQDVVFFSMNWTRIGTKISLKTLISETTGVEGAYLTGSKPIWLASIAKRMSWMSKRVTTRIEDLAYCMLGIFEINMPLIYGEGQRSFLRLQEEILKSTDDQSIFCWEWNRIFVIDSWASILAPCPAVFRNSGEFCPTAWDDASIIVPYNITNAGLSIKLPFVRTANPSFVCAVLQVRQEWVRGEWDADFPYSQQVCIPLEKARIYRRLPFPTRPFPLHMAMAGREKNVHIISRARSVESSRGYISTHAEIENLFSVPNFDIGFLLTFDPKESEAIIPELCYCTTGGIFIERRSVLGFSFAGTNTAESFAAGIMKMAHRGAEDFMLLLAIRMKEAANGTRNFFFYCQTIPQALVRALDRGLLLSDIVHEAERSSVHIGEHIDFCSNGLVTVALGSVILYSSSDAGCGKAVVRVVHVVGEDRNRSSALWEDMNSNISLFGEEGF